MRYDHALVRQVVASYYACPLSSAGVASHRILQHFYFNPLLPGRYASGHPQVGIGDASCAGHDGWRVAQCSREHLHWPGQHCR